MQLNSTIHLPGLEAFTVQKSEEVYTSNVHDYRTQKMQHTRMFGRRAYVFYRKRRYICRSGFEKRFHEDNTLVERYQRQSTEMKQALAMELVHGKSFKDVAHRLDTSPATVIRRFDSMITPLLEQTETLPEVIAIDEYKGGQEEKRIKRLLRIPLTENLWKS